MTYQQFLTETSYKFILCLIQMLRFSCIKSKKIMALLWMDSLFCKRAATFLPLFISMIITKNIRQEKAYITLFYISGKFTGLTVPAALSM